VAGPHAKPAARTAETRLSVTNQKQKLAGSAQTPAERLVAAQVPSRTHAKDATLFDFSEVALESARGYMGWTDLASNPPTPLDQIADFARAAIDEGLNYVGLLGEGGSSQAPMTITKLTAASHRDIRFSTLDSLSPLYVKQILHGVDYHRSIFVVSSKSGGTVETLSLFKVIWDDVVRELGAEQAGARFVAITDPGSELEKLARELKFRGTFLGEPTVGGRFSALSVFGLVPAALVGLDIRELVARAAEMERLCATDAPTNPAVILADFLACNLSMDSANCFTYISPQPGRVFGLWMEQLIAESLGKDGHGVVPHIEIDVNLLNHHLPAHPVVVYHTNPDSTFDREASMLSPTVAQRSYMLEDPIDIGRHFVLWEYATSFLGWLMKVPPFNQPDVQQAKTNTKRVLAGELPDHTHRLVEPWVVAEYSEAFAERSGIVDLTQMHSVDAVISAFMDMVQPDNWISVNAFLPFTGERRGPMEIIRHTLARHLEVPVSLEIGPRYLHSTGQLQKGGPDNGVFLILSGTETDDIAVPGENYSLGGLEVAQSKGDLATLSAKGRRALHLHLADTDADTLWRLAHAF
jgi:glucose-6-phosphate isomerase